MAMDRNIVSSSHLADELNLHYDCKRSRTSVALPGDVEVVAPELREPLEPVHQEPMGVSGYNMIHTGSGDACISVLDQIMYYKYAIDRCQCNKDEEHESCVRTGELVAELAEIPGGVGVGEPNACW
jgi:hypothetical protein